MKIFKVDTLNDMNCLQNHPEDEVVYVTNEQKYFIWNDNKYEEYHFKTSGVDINLYELNQQIVSQLEPLNQEQLFSTENICTLDAFQIKTDNKYYMFLCNELKSYTIFTKSCKCKNQAVHSFSVEVLDLIAEYGSVYAIGLTDDKAAIEVWIKSEADDKPHAYYLFPYDAGVIYYE